MSMLARENAIFSQEIRQLIYGRGKATHRILFTVLDEQAIPIVRILHVRKAIQNAIGESEEDSE